MAGTAVSVYTSLESGKQAKEAADYNARITENNAAFDEAAARQGRNSRRRPRQACPGEAVEAS